MAIHAERLQVAYRDKVVWSDATFDVLPGEFVAVIGPNGAGKTTLFRLLLGLQEPLTGTLSVLGEGPHRANRRIGYVPQRHSVDSETHLQAVSLVELAISGTRFGPPGLGISGQGPPLISGRRERESAWRALEMVGATELAFSRLGSLSGGELQRIFLAEALVGGPEMLLLDEPLSNLDLRRSRTLVHLIHEIVRARKVTTLLVAHDINPLIQCLDKVIYIANGRVAVGRPDQVLTSTTLSALYRAPVEVLHDSRGNLVIVGGEDIHGSEEP